MILGLADMNVHSPLFFPAFLLTNCINVELCDFPQAFIRLGFKYVCMYVCLLYVVNMYAYEKKRKSESVFGLQPLLQTRNNKDLLHVKMTHIKKMHSYMPFCRTAALKDISRKYSFLLFSRTHSLNNAQLLKHLAIQIHFLMKPLYFSHLNLSYKHCF